MSMDLAGRNIVITGGTGGLGTGVVQTLVDAGAHCYIADYSHVTEEQYPLLAHERVTVFGGEAG